MRCKVFIEQLAILRGTSVFITMIIGSTIIIICMFNMAIVIGWYYHCYLLRLPGHARQAEQQHEGGGEEDGDHLVVFIIMSSSHCFFAFVV